MNGDAADVEGGAARYRSVEPGGASQSSSFTRLSSTRRFLEESDQLPDGAVAVTGVPEREVIVDHVPVPTPLPAHGHIARLSEVANDGCCRPFGDSDRVGDIPKARAWVRAKERKDVRVVRDEPKPVIRFR
jgi:hypothetical protein